MKINKYILIISLLLAGCAQKSKLDFFPDIYNELPKSILVLPPINKSTSADATEYYSTTIAEPLSFAGYYVYPIEITKEVLKSEGIYDASLLKDIPMAKFQEYFGADAVLFTEIIEWDKSFYVIGGNVEVNLEFVLKSTKTEKTLWSYKGNIKVDTSSDDSEIPGLAGFLLEVAVTAVKTAAQDYVPIAKKINVQGLITIPYGYYHAKFNQDQAMMITIRPDGSLYIAQ